MVNRNKCKQWSITFPQSKDMKREDFVKKFPPHVSCICSQEEHEDGGLHLHLGIKLLKGLSKPGMLKWIKAKFPDDFKRIDVQPTRSIKCWADYLAKEDPFPYIVEEKREKRETALESANWLHTEVMNECIDRKTLRKAERDTKIYKCEAVAKFREDDMWKCYWGKMKASAPFDEKM